MVLGKHGVQLAQRFVLLLQFTDLVAQPVEFFARNTVGVRTISASAFRSGRRHQSSTLLAGFGGVQVTLK
jgi:hypothetical protein